METTASETISAPLTPPVPPPSSPVNPTSTLKLGSLVDFYLPFERVDDEARIVDGYCYTSAEVESDERDDVGHAVSKRGQAPASRGASPRFETDRP